MIPSYTRKIYLVRHGETLWSKQGKHTGLTDLSLTEDGKQEASRLKAHLESFTFEQVLCSPLKRAQETCALTGYLDRAVLEPLLVEWNYGAYEGKTSKEIHQTDPSWTIFTKGAPSGESPEQIKTRALSLFGKLEKTHGNILLFSSGHFIRSLGALWLGLGIEWGKAFVTSTASLSILGYERLTPALLLWNYRPHL